jgi:hypothetical protein
MAYFIIGSQIVAAITGAGAAYQASATARDTAKYNSAIANIQADDEQRRGEQEAQAALRKARQIGGAQRAAFSARGLDISEGTPADLIDQTDFFGQVDAATSRDNARKAGWSKRQQAKGFDAQAAAQNPGLSFATTLLASAPAVADRYSKSFPKKG